MGNLIGMFLGCVNTNYFKDEGEVDEGFKHDIELFEARKDASEAF